MTMTIVNRQIGVEESKYGVAGAPYLCIVRWSRDPILEFWDPLHISVTVESRNFKFDTQMDDGPHGVLTKEDEK